MEFNAKVSEQVSRLLNVYGPEATECLLTLGVLLKDRLEELESAATIGTRGGDENQSSHKPPTPRPLTESLSTSGNVESIVLQTIHMEHEASPSEMETLVQAGINVFRYWACIEESNTESSIIDPLCELMTKYPQNEVIQESACVRLSKQKLLLSPAKTPTSPSSAEKVQSEKQSQIQRILFPTLQAMNWHKNNPVLWNAGMIVITRLLVKSSSTADLTERQFQAIALIDLTGGLTIFFDSLLKQAFTNKFIQSELKVNVCHALAALALNNTTNQALIAQQPGLSRVLDTMKLHTYHVPLQESLLHLLASLAYGTESKTTLLSKGGLDCILTCMKDHPMESTIQATGCRAIANLFAGTSSEIRAKGSLCLKPVLRAMRMHPPQIEGANEETAQHDQQHHEQEVSSVQIHFYGCAALCNLAKAHSRAIIEAGGIVTVLVTLSAYSNRPAIQEQGWAALFFLMQTGTKDDCVSICTEGGLETLMETLRRYTSHARLQTIALKCLAYLASTEKLQIMERIVSGKAIDLVLSALYRYHKTGPAQLLLHGSSVLVSLTRNNPDFQLIIIVKNGINILIMVLQHTKQDVRVQLTACEILHHLCRDNLPLAASSGSMLPILISIVKSHPDEKELLICALDTLGLLATLPQVQRELLARQGLEDLVPLIKNHKDNTTLLELGINFLSHCSQEPDATLWMKRNQVIPFLQSTITELPRRSQARTVALELIKHLQTTRVFLARLSNTHRTG